MSKRSRTPRIAAERPEVQAAVSQERTHDDWTSFSAGAGRWATAQLKKLAVAGEALSTSVLRTADTLRHDDWRMFDDVLEQSFLIRLSAVANLISKGLTKNVPGSLGKTVYTYEKMTFMDPADVTMDGRSKTPNDKQEFTLASVPLPITHKDFFLNLRQLSSSRNSNTPLDTTQVATAGRVIAEKAEDMLINGGRTFGGLPIYGYLTAPSKNTMGFLSNKHWGDSTKAGVDYITDVLSALNTLASKRRFGPFTIILPTDAGVRIENDYVATGGNNPNQTIRQRLERIEQISSVIVADTLASGYVIMTQDTADNVVWLQGEPLQTVQWDEDGGFTINFKAFQIAVPLFRTDWQNRSGVMVMH